MPELILGISAFYHDSAAALLQDGEILSAAHEERFTRKKHDPGFPAQAVKFLLKDAGIRVSDLNAIAFYDKPYLKFERLLETYHAFVPRGMASFLAAMPVWIKEKLFMRKLLWEELEKANGKKISKRPTLLFPEHHLSHAASAFFPSPYSEAAILTIDGVGEWATTTLGKGKDSAITLLRELDFPHSIGLLYSAFTYFCGFRVNSGEYKLMGLAPYGDPESDRCRKYRELILEHLVDLRDDGSLLLNMKYFSYATGLRMVNDRKWKQLFGLSRRQGESDFSQEYMDLALAIQQVTEEAVFRLARTAARETGCRNLVMAGGVALNCVANGKLQDMKLFDNIWIQPAAGDAGGALGAAYAAHHIWKNHPRRVFPGSADAMRGSYLGPQFSNKDVVRLGRRFNAPFENFKSFDDLCGRVSKLLAEGQVVGWFQGQMEWGPRALGNRSILGDPRHPEMQKKLNLKIKYREGFRPFAPSVLAEDAGLYFDLRTSSPYMLMVAPVREEHRKPLPENYRSLDMYPRLYHQRSNIPAVTHVDYSARIQTVHRETNERYWKLISAFKEHTGIGLVVNTSFNVRGEPIVCTPQDAYLCFMRTEMDFLVIQDNLFSKSEQPSLSDDKDWKLEFELD